MRSLPTVPFLTHGAVVSLAFIIAVGLVLSGSARFRPDLQSAEAAPTDEVKKLLASDAQAGDGKQGLLSTVRFQYARGGLSDMQ